MGDWGAKSSTVGHDVETAADYLQSFSSSWPLLKIEHQGPATVTLNSTPQTIYTHNLGYPPMYIIIKDGAVVAFPPGIGVDSTVLAYDGVLAPGGSYSFYYYVIRVPLNQNFTAGSIASSTTKTAVDGDFGIKITIPGKSTDSTDMRDFVVHTSTRSIMLHKVDTGTLSPFLGNYLRTVPHGLGFIPTAFCYVKFGTGLSGYNPAYYYSINGPQGVQDADFSLDETNMYIFQPSTFATAPADATAVFLKDPFAKETINVSFP